MNSEITYNKELNFFEIIFGIFLSPEKTFNNIDRNPNWIIPFFIISVIAIVLSYLITDIYISDQLAALDNYSFSQEQKEIISSSLKESNNYLHLLLIPLWYLAIWSISAGFIFFGGNVIMEGNVLFIKIYSIVAWCGLIDLLGEIITTLIIVFKGTTVGVTMSLAILLPITDIFFQSSIQYYLLSQFDLFIIWKLILWIIGVSVIFHYPTKKSAKLVLSLWSVWLAVSATFFRSDFLDFFYSY